MSIKVKIGGKDFDLSPVPFKGLVALGSRLELIGGDFTEEAADALIDGLYYGIKRNHSDIDREFIELNIDMTNLNQVLTAFMDVNGFGKANKATKSGERKAGK